MNNPMNNQIKKSPESTMTVAPNRHVRRAYLVSATIIGIGFLSWGGVLEACYTAMGDQRHSCETLSLPFAVMYVVIALIPVVKAHWPAKK